MLARGLNEDDIDTLNDICASADYTIDTSELDVETLATNPVVQKALRKLAKEVVGFLEYEEESSVEPIKETSETPEDTSGSTMPNFDKWKNEQAWKFYEIGLRQRDNANYFSASTAFEKAAALAEEAGNPSLVKNALKNKSSVDKLF